VKAFFFLFGVLTGGSVLYLYQMTREEMRTGEAIEGFFPRVQFSRERNPRAFKVRLVTSWLGIAVLLAMSVTSLIAFVVSFI